MINKTLIEEIGRSDEVTLDCLFSLLRERKFGVMRKVKGFSFILDIEEEIALNEAAKDESGRLLDHVNRHSLADALVARSKELKQQTNEN